MALSDFRNELKKNYEKYALLCPKVFIAIYHDTAVTKIFVIVLCDKKFTLWIYLTRHPHRKI